MASSQERAIDAALLRNRVAANAGAQQLDLAEWIRAGLNVKAGSTVVELCAGTGSQTRLLAEAVGADGQVTAVDVSVDALAQVKSEIGARYGNVETVVADIDLFAADIPAESIDLAFCAYGLYYSANAGALLDSLLSSLSPVGRIVVVGPYGPNNAELYNVLEAHGVSLPERVLHSSSRFMTEEVLPWALANVSNISIRTASNPVVWKDVEQVMDYWRNTTFYVPAKDAAVLATVQDIVRKQSAFVNTKHIMMMEMRRD